jgi:hypothetical protein
MTTMGATNTELEQARSIYFSLGGLESDLGPRDDPNWYWRRAAKMARDERIGATRTLVEFLNKHQVQPTKVHTLESAIEQVCKWAELQKSWFDEDEKKRVAAQNESTALRERVAKLEALLMRARKHWGPGASNERCDCDGCTIIRDIAALVPNSAKDGTLK